MQRLFPQIRGNLKDLERALAELKNNKSRDHAGYVNEVFKDGCIGTDLKKSLLTMLNKVKCQRLIPEFMKVTNHKEYINEVNIS